jgi:exopolyphosphatase / guanosine-5'-triphosphate,3'-diphosphate pyrophosphatase
MTDTDCVAAIDIGTNSVLLTIADSMGQPVEDRAQITRLGEGCDSSGVLLDSAIERTLTCIKSYADVLEARGIKRLAIAATSATRDAANGAAFTKQVEAITGCAPEIVSGQREAELTFRGSLAGLTLRTNAKSAGDVEVCVFDIGGGSTELIRGRRKAGSGDSAESSESGGLEIEDSISLDIGSVRLTERFVSTDPPTDRERAAVADEVWGALSVVTPPGEGATLVGVAGTVTTLCAIAKHLEPYDGAAVHGETLGGDTVRGLIEALASVPLAARREIAGLEPKRADVIVAGAILTEQILSWAGSAGCTVSDRGVRWGLIAELLGNKAP